MGLTVSFSQSTERNLYGDTAPAESRHRRLPAPCQLPARHSRATSQTRSRPILLNVRDPIISFNRISRAAFISVRARTTTPFTPALRAFAPRAPRRRAQSRSQLLENHERAGSLLKHRCAMRSRNPSFTNARSGPRLCDAPLGSRKAKLDSSLVRDRELCKRARTTGQPDRVGRSDGVSRGYE